MKKTIILILSLLILTVLLAIILISGSLDNLQNNKNLRNIYTYTKAICDDNNYCQDNLIKCKDSQIIGIIPITGAAVQFSEDWKDPRDLETINKLC